MPVILNADNGAVSGISGLTTTADNSGVLQFQSSGTNTLTITTAGNVGVGTVSPTNVTNYKFITLNATTGAVYQAYGASSTDGRFFADNAYGGTGMFSNHPFLFYTNSSERMRISSTGNVGIGTSSPTTALTVAGVGRFLSGTEGTQIGHNGTIGYIETAGNSATPITFYNGGTERMRIDSSGNVGIGTAAPSSFGKFVVFGGVSAFVNSGADGTLSSCAAFQLTGFGTEFQNIIQSSVSLNIQNSVYAFRVCSGSNATTEAMRIQGTRLVLNGGSTTAQAGTGITFPATQSASSDANTLDDYEEGSWAPSVGGNATYSVQQGQYIKIGKLVYVQGKIQIATLGTGNTLNITNLPFGVDVSAGSINGSASTTYFSSLAVSAGALIPFVQANTTQMGFNTNSSTGTTQTGYNAAVFGNNTRIDFCCTYQTNA